MQSDELTVEQVAALTGWAQSTVRKHADALGARRKGARKLLFTDAGVRAGLVQLRKHNDLIPLAEMQLRSGRGAALDTHTPPAQAEAGHIVA